jgi:hypothetical protein
MGQLVETMSLQCVVGSRLALELHVTQSPTTHTNTFTTLLAEAGCSVSQLDMDIIYACTQRYQTGVSKRACRGGGAHAPKATLCLSVGACNTNERLMDDSGRAY